MYVAQQGYNSKTKAQRVFLAGVFTQITRQISGTNALTGGAEIYYDRLIEDPLTAKNFAASRLFAGVHAGHAFLLGRITLDQQVGVYVFNQTSYFKKMYFRFGLNYRFTKHWCVGANLKSHTDNADFADGRVMYRF